MAVSVNNLFIYASLFTFGCVSMVYVYFLPLWRDHDLVFRLSSSSTTRSLRDHWIDSWTATPQPMEYRTAVYPPFRDVDPAFANTTIRQTVQLTIGAETVRLRLSNAFGKTDLPITNVTVSLPRVGDKLFLGSGAIRTYSLQTVTFSGSRSVTIPEGALAVSDPISFDQPIEAGQVLTVSMYLRDGQQSDIVTAHRTARTTAWMEFGDHTRSLDISGQGSAPHWYILSAVEVWKRAHYKTLVVIGDSITDGGAADMNSNERWTQVVFDRMQARRGLQHIGVANQGAGGNQLLYDGRAPSAASRLDRDVLAQSGVGYVVIFEGVNDIGHAAPTVAEQRETETRLIHYYKQIIARIHAFGIPVFGGTLTPFWCQPQFPGNHYSDDPIREETRLRVNDWIRNSGYFDAVIDFDAGLRDPQNTTEMRPEYINDIRGDCLHPNEDGYHQLAAQFPLEILEKFKDGSWTILIGNGSWNDDKVCAQAYLLRFTKCDRLSFNSGDVFDASIEALPNTMFYFKGAELHV